MTITQVCPGTGDTLLQDIADLFTPRNRTVVVTGAGISTNAGIPDFRSNGGLFSEALERPQERRRERNLQGRDMFHSSVLLHEDTMSAFYEYTTELHRRTQEAKPTETHHFIRTLRDVGMLAREYTQNIDGIAERAGLNTGLSRDRVDCVPLHGSLRYLRCALCSKQYPWDAHRERETAVGRAPFCPGCSELSAGRVRVGKRATSIGQLRPDVVLYDEYDARQEDISDIVQRDLSLRPRLLLILGTTLSTDGIKPLVKDFAAVVHNNGGKVVLVNLTEPAKSVWRGVIDYWVEWDCDAWVRDLRSRKPALLQYRNLGNGPLGEMPATSKGVQLGSREWPIDLT